MTVFRSSNGTQTIGSASGGDSQNASLGGTGDVIKVLNTSDLNAFVKVGVGSQTATTADLLVRANSEAFFQIDFADDSIAVKTPNSPRNLYVMRGSAS